MDSVRPLASRNGESNPRGKLTAQLSIPCDETLREALTALAFLRNMTLAEYVRSVLTESCFGRVPIAREACARSDQGSTVGIRDEP